MRLLPEEKLEIIQMVTRSEIGGNRTLRELGIHKSTFYKWYNLYLEKGEAGFHSSPSSGRRPLMYSLFHDSSFFHLKRKVSKLCSNTPYQNKNDETDDEMT